MSYFDALPSVSFAPLDAGENERNIIRRYEEHTKTTLYPGDPVRLFLEAVAMDITVLCNLLDRAGKQNLLAFAEKAHLDHLGALMDTPRLGQSAAKCNICFMLTESLDFAVSIPQGTRMTTQDKRIAFATDATVAIEPGKLAAEISATSEKPGQLGNGLVPGQVCLLVDPIAYVARVWNSTLSAGGTEIEEDTAYRDRIRLAPESFTCAGSEGSYRSHALAVSPEIAEVAVWSPKPGQVDVRPVLQGGELPGPELLEAVRSALSAEDVRPLTDTVTVGAPEVVPYSIKGGWYLRKTDAALAGNISKAVAAAVEQFRLWQRSAPGRDINPTRLIALAERAGAKRVALEAPQFAVLKGWQIAREEGITFELLGIEDD